MYFSEHPVLAPDLPTKSRKVYNTVFSPFPLCKATQAHRDQPKDPHLQEFYCITNMPTRSGHSHEEPEAANAARHVLNYLSSHSSRTAVLAVLMDGTGSGLMTRKSHWHSVYSKEPSVLPIWSLVLIPAPLIIKS